MKPAKQKQSPIYVLFNSDENQQVSASLFESGGVRIEVRFSKSLSLEDIECFMIHYRDELSSSGYTLTGKARENCFIYGNQAYENWTLYRGEDYRSVEFCWTQGGE
tara:strand:- start:366 stop:683 length:318 start_codon:yes stop_codon:yes gene_type:complete